MPRTFETEIEVRFSDFDLYGHVNSVLYFGYCEAARISILHEVLKEMSDNDLYFVVARAGCEYLCPILFGEKVVVSTHASRMGRTSFDLRYRLGDGREKNYAVANTTMVCFDNVGKRAVAVPEIVKQILY
ncbi:acyl-CoA thioesterase [Geomonas azotofigens]|uniref:acyl-CoA thioesterase n=1 Tax=Geomonas azotofigens TaxID=2843196 RepID=UPI001C11AFF2|nr:thioesterase family protein [Geomonas azotofigens]MBU5613826.1 acyl-CoA thioesterase [Geomonas azotofigens]